jgi:hypothetical protein
VLYAGVRVLEILLQAQSMAAAIGQVVLVEWGSAQLGIRWSTPQTQVTALRIVRRAAFGAVMGLGATALVFATLLATRSVRVERVDHVEASVLVIGFATAALYAWRDELLLHGVPLRALEDTSVSALGRTLACGVASAGAALGRSDATGQSVFVAFLLGNVFGALWVRDRGAWQAWAAHTMLRWSSTTLLSGGVVYSRLADNAWAGTGGLFGGTAAVTALAPVGMMALAWAVRRISPRSAGVG